VLAPAPKPGAALPLATARSVKKKRGRAGHGVLSRGRWRRGLQAGGVGMDRWWRRGVDKIGLD
jgi:hypothetical protein